ncbi:hypothetical protein NKR23_g8528 [Pleurostoma richardsiae]|uniref:Alpha/beta hydrolase fold-3 domain-containing protein n=1 Tax=Pleurostoma richardsiae TaxID=41990 RepID=A0AA38RQL6_9PEZI|nr:hypothetical protein NKR23_g8528 [Pleurostoma richardsiae]
MEAIKASIAKHGNVWSLQTNNDMTALYEPLHAARASLFADTVSVEKGLKYGPHERHRLDVYKPTAAASEPLPVDIITYTAVGNYFASNGCVCFLGTYRLLPEARYPSGGEDTTAALKWVQDNAAQYGGDSSRITAVGQSAGGAHLANAAFSGLMKAAGVGLRGLVLLSPPLSYDLRQERRRKNMFTYHGTESEEEVMGKTGVAVFRGAEKADLEGLNLLLQVAELDSNEIVDGNLAFVAEYRKKFSRMPLFEVMPGHNHISNTLAIGLPGDTVGRRILEFATQ